MGSVLFPNTRLNESQRGVGDSVNCYRKQMKCLTTAVYRCATGIREPSACLYCMLVVFTGFCTPIAAKSHTSRDTEKIAFRTRFVRMERAHSLRCVFLAPHMCDRVCECVCMCVQLHVASGCTHAHDSHDGIIGTARTAMRITLGCVLIRTICVESRAKMICA